MKHSRHFKLLLLTFICVFGSFQAPSEGTNLNKNTIYFYNPEANIDNFALLKKEFDAYLSRHGSYVFTPFNKAQPFEQALAEAEDGLFIVSSWHFKTLNTTHNLTPVLVAEVQGSSTHTKALRCSPSNGGRTRSARCRVRESPPPPVRPIPKKSFRVCAI